MTKVIEAQYREWKPNHKKQKAPSLVVEPINEDVIVIDKDHQTVVVAQLSLPKELEATAKKVQQIMRHKIKWGSLDNSRLSGIISSNRVFGTLAPEKLRQRYGCTKTSLDKEQPELIQLLETLAISNYDLFKSIDPHGAGEHEKIVTKAVHPDWLFGGTPFTSGVINCSSALPYHKDNGNLVGSWSMMLSLRKDIAGGYLHLPEYDLLLGVPNNSVTIFNGQTLWHGVTPMVIKKKDAYRFTIVWYAKTNVRLCGCKENEIQRAAKEASKLL
jgi:hypothetical protein